MDITEEIRPMVRAEDGTEPDELAAYSLPTGHMIIIARLATCVQAGAYVGHEIVPGAQVLTLVGNTHKHLDSPEEASAYFQDFARTTEAASTALDVGGDPFVAVQQLGQERSNFMVI
jgi:hypothetical protein